MEQIEIKVDLEKFVERTCLRLYGVVPCRDSDNPVIQNLKK